MAEQYSLEGVAEKIRCPMLVTDPENEQCVFGRDLVEYRANSLDHRERLNGSVPAS